MSQLAEQLIEQSLITKDPYLDLGNCGLRGDEPCLARLADCTHLTTLIFSDEWVEWGEVRQGNYLKKAKTKEKSTN